MFRKIAALAAVVVVSLGFSQVSLAESESAENATIVVYRADESLKTKRLGMDLHIGQGSLGRLKSDDSMVITRPAGQYTLNSSLTGTESLVIDLKPGQTHYVYTDLKMRGTRVSVSFSEVEEQVAKVQQPSLGQTI
jgi:hypothetical protein